MSIAAQLTIQLLEKPFYFCFDTAMVEELQIDKAAEATRVQGLVMSGLRTVKEAQEELGYEPDDHADVYLVSGQIIPKGEYDTFMPLDLPPTETDTMDEEDDDEEDEE